MVPHDAKISDVTHKFNLSFLFHTVFSNIL